MLQLIQARDPSKRLVLKSPCHCFNLETLAQVLPEARLVCMHRDPFTLAASDASLTARLHAASVRAMDLQAVVKANTTKIAVYSDNIASFAEAAPSSRLFHAPYWKLVADPTGLVHDIHAAFGLHSSAEHDGKMRAYLRSHAQDSMGKHRYSLEGVGLSRAALRPMFEQYLSHFEHLLTAPGTEQSGKDRPVGCQTAGQRSAKATKEGDRRQSADAVVCGGPGVKVLAQSN